VQPYQTIPHAMWFLVVTLTTVGYGDVRRWLSIPRALGCKLAVYAQARCAP
jgi:hypothetical protein